MRIDTIRLRQSAVWLALGLTIVAMLVVRPTLIAPEQWPILLRQAAPLGVLAIGQTILLIGGGFDMSVGGVVGFVSVLAAGPFAQSQGVGAVIFACLILGIAVGVLNGAIVTFGKVSPLVATLGTGFVLTGAMLIYTGGAPTGHVPDGIRALSREKFLGVPLAVDIWLALALLAGLMLNKSWFGRYVYAIGSGPKAAIYAGVAVTATQLASYVLSSLCAVVGGLLLAGFVGIGALGAGQELTLDSLAAAVIGGTLLSGGVGGMTGTVGGVVLLTALSTLLTGAGAGAAGSSLVHGLVLLGASILFREAKRG
ncbi:MAG: ABC transporter permease [Roseiarcus sp.]|jgi:ribose/xylose/arabinose/galactoside ABC-type transport system permease subunit|uniref:ABC transporter permease n=1 Tax=Roseiarcus sp. TaxID=1969460 RepID=UPI003C1FDFA5